MIQSASTGRLARLPRTLQGRGVRALTIQGLLLVSASFLLPAGAHLAGLPVRLLIPMHWPVILVGLCYGWRSGVLVGLISPSLSFLVSGMPYPVVLPAMTLELGAYGFLAGFLREKLCWNGFLATLGAVIGGRILFVLSALLTGATGDEFQAYLRIAILPGLLAALAQVFLLPPIASWWLSREGRK